MKLSAFIACLVVSLFLIGMPSRGSAEEVAGTPAPAPAAVTEPSSCSSPLAELFAAPAAEGPQAPVAAATCASCTLSDIERCNDYCVSRGCLWGECRSLCDDRCFCTC